MVFTSCNLFSFHKAIRNQIVKVKDTEDVPMVLVGNKADLADKRQVSKDEAQTLANKICKGKYFESSAKNNTNISEVFEELVTQVAIKYPEKKKDNRGCTLL